MKIAMIGSGYVGLVTGACLAEVGHTVACVDVDPEKGRALNTGVIPIFEPGLVASNNPLQAWLKYRDYTRIQRPDLLWVDIHARDRVSCLSEASASH